MNPYQLKQATIPGLLMSANNAVGMPGLGNMVGGGVKFVGKMLGTKENPHWLYHKGKEIDRVSTNVTEGINHALNHGHGIEYDPTKWHSAIKAPLDFIGVNVKNPNQKMTAQRAAIWAGGALTLHDQLKPFLGGGSKSKANAPQPRRDDGMTPSMLSADPIVSAQKQASLDILEFIRHAEENV